MYNLFKSVTSHSIEESLPTHPQFPKLNNLLHDLVDNYFSPENVQNTTTVNTDINTEQLQIDMDTETSTKWYGIILASYYLFSFYCRIFIRGDVVSFLQRHGGIEWSGRNVARIFHGLASTKFPYEEWCKDPSWACHRCGIYSNNTICHAILILF